MARVRPDEFADQVAGLVRRRLRAPSGYATDDATGAPVFDFDPPLTVAEQARFDTLAEMARAAVSLTEAEWAAIRPHLQSLRDFRQSGRPAFMALTAAERDRMLYDAQTATTIVLLALLRG